MNTAMYSQCRSLYELLIATRMVANMWSNSSVNAFYDRPLELLCSFRKFIAAHRDVQDRYVLQTLSHS